MAIETVRCPKCSFEIPITEALTGPIRDRLRTELAPEIKRREASLAELQGRLKEREEELNREKVDIDQQVAAKLKEQAEKIRAESERAAIAKLGIELKDLRNQVKDKDKKISHAQKLELDLRKQARDLEAKQQELELEVARKVDAEREKIQQEAFKRYNEEHRLKDLEKEKIIQDLRKALGDAKRKAEQGSMQTQGEVLELDLENQLKNSFPFDKIEPVPKGIKGADVIQRVFDSTHKACGIVLWESKHTKNWSDSWIQKLKDDQRAIGAEIAVIVTEAMPKNVESFAFLNGVWVTNFGSAIGLATALRQHRIDVTFAHRASVGKNEKMEALYQYLSGPEFHQKVEAIVETFTAMQSQIEKEKRAMTKIWSQREKEIQRIVTNTVGMYGDMRGIIGASLPEIQALELDASPKQLADHSAEDNEKS